MLPTTATDIDPELANRLVVLGVDEDRVQTRAIQAAQRQAATLDGLMARLQRERIVAVHRNAQRLIEPLPVVIPDTSHTGSRLVAAEGPSTRRFRMELRASIPLAGSTTSMSTSSENRRMSLYSFERLVPPLKMIVTS